MKVNEVYKIDGVNYEILSIHKEYCKCKYFDKPNGLNGDYVPLTTLVPKIFFVNGEKMPF